MLHKSGIFYYDPLEVAQMEKIIVGGAEDGCLGEDVLLKIRKGRHLPHLCFSPVYPFTGFLSPALRLYGFIELK